MRIRIMTFGLGLAATALMAVPAVKAQRWEIGGGGGGSFYNKLSVSNPAGAVDAGFKPGYAFTAYLAQSGNGRRIGGEVRYTLLGNGMELNGGGKNFTMSGRSQAIHYDVLIFTGRQDSDVRPYLSMGGGVKLYEGTGDDMAVQPLGKTAVLTRTTQWKPMVSFGGGVRFRVGDRGVLRAEVKVYGTQAPSDVITPVGASALSGWFFNIAPVVSIGYIF